MSENDPFREYANLIQKRITKYRNSSSRRSPGGSARGFGVFGAITAIGAISGLLWNSFFIVPTGHKAIKFNRFSGVGDFVYGEGLRLMIPAIERPIVYDVRIRPTEISSSTGSKDLQNVKSTVRIIHKPSADHLQTIYRQYGYNYAERIMPSIVNECMKSVIASFNAEELLTKRNMVTAEIERQLKHEASRYHITIDDVSILNLGFGREYSKAVEDKQVAKQESERAKYEVMKAKHEKQSKIVTAQGEAKAIQIVGEQMKKSEGYLVLRRIQTAREIAEIISTSQNRVYLPSDALLVSLESQSMEKKMERL
eukprot:CAMPEP_0117450138 /NCGR_PEP_ID=MMETSP0759-20121206/8309_1 /TAXON_ID=63605 /ORGANISM="Percolomonas cosmopolitus, Strain WS" /LENGTH=310 /DNA_ID=CAMNT_0005242641 /DNA_START=150 /DNA_END=1082 /DNA_ORIENTATION=-